MKNNFVVKCIAIVLFAVFMTTLLLSGACIIFGFGSEAFVSSAKEQAENKNRFLQSFLYNYEHRIHEAYQNYVQYGLDNGESYDAYQPYFSDNILYEIKNKNGDIVYSTIDESAGELTVSFGRSFSVLKEEYRNKDDIIKETHEEYETGVQIGNESSSEPVSVEKTETSVQTENIYSSGTVTEEEATTSLDMTIHGTFEPETVPSTSKYYDDKSYTVTISYKDEPIEKDCIYYMGMFYDFVSENESKIYIATTISSILSLILFIIILRLAGHTEKSDDIYISKFDKFPVDILTAIYCGLTVLLGLGCVAVYYSTDDWWYYDEILFEAIPFFIALCVIGIIVDFILLAILLMTASVRFKTSTFIKSTIIYKIIVLIWKILKIIWKYLVQFIKWLWKGYVKTNKTICNFIRKIPLVWKTVFSIIVLVFLEIFIYAITVDWFEPGILFFNMLLCVGVIFVAILLKDIKKGTEEIANGNVYKKIDTKYLFLDLKDHAENINNMSDGIQKAVAEQMKSERLKTELITNVSHDIKTPLTSIINYVDLLEKEEIQSETAKEYIDVLSRQSTRLKKLIDDLLEASKASTGNINVNLSQLELGILLSQALVEYEEKFAKNNLQIILNKSDDMLLVMADNRHIWRVFDNILNNISKYAQPDTRVYIDARRKGNSAEICFRNISKEQLNISGDELMERFVRGDSSRNTEGSGLGLSIAKSLTEIQNGKLTIEIDGDLFKVRVAFPLK
ncbi:MAG: HAMP domain-containing histidine kinase [Clostridia bacterium]|nr:HAMP domain-containing histidine kinase [Clostridia bacterium]